MDECAAPPVCFSYDDRILVFMETSLHVADFSVLSIPESYKSTWIAKLDPQVGSGSVRDWHSWIALLPQHVSAYWPQ